MMEKKGRWEEGKLRCGEREAPLSFHGLRSGGARFRRREGEDA